MAEIALVARIFRKSQRERDVLVWLTVAVKCGGTQGGGDMDKTIMNRFRSEIAIRNIAHQ